MTEITSPISAPAVLDREFLELRAKLLELAASFDRLDRSAGSVATDPRYERLQQALQIVAREEPGRAEAIQRLFSREYHPQWRSEFSV